MKLLLLLLFCITSFNTHSAGNPNDDFKLGKKSSSLDKGITFDTDDGVLNKTLKVEKASKKLKWSGNDLQIGDGASVNDKELTLDSASTTSIKWNGTSNYVELRSEKVSIGKGVDNDMDLQFDIGGSNPAIKYNSAKGKIQFSNDGALFKDIGSGGGSGSGGINILANSGFEDGKDESWTYTIATAIDLSGADVITGEKSLRFDPTNINEFLKSDPIALKNDLKGTSCQAELTYLGGDEFLNARVIDGNSDTLAEITLKAHSVASKESIFFLCPNATEIGIDAQKGNLRLEIYQNSATNAVAIDLDNLYLGSLIGLIETTTPDLCSAYITNNGTATIVSQTGGCIASAVRSQAGVIDITFTAGYYTQLPAVVAYIVEAGVSNYFSGADNFTLTGMRIGTDGDGSANGDRDIGIFLTKQGADAKQSVQVYKSIPTIGDNINYPSARIANNGTASIQSQIGGAIQSVNRTSLGLVAVTFTPGFFTVPPLVFVDGNLLTVWTSKGNGVTTSGFSFDTKGQTNVSLDADVDIFMVKQGADFKMPTVQPIIVGQVRNSSAEANQKNVTIEMCDFEADTTPTIENATMCNSWVESLTYTGTAGLFTVAFNSGTFSEKPVCMCTASHKSSLVFSDLCNVNNYATDLTKDQVKVFITNINGTGVNTGSIVLKCQGVK